MKWRGRRTSTNVEDRRGTVVKGAAIGGGVGGGILILVIMLILNFCGGGDLSQTLNNSQLVSSTVATTYQETQQEKELAQFVSVVLAETEDVWTEIFSKESLNYTYPKLVLYTDYVESACGMAGLATGPFYCPSDQKVYIDLSFYRELQQRFNAPGDFAMAYVMRQRWFYKGFTSGTLEGGDTFNTDNL